MLTSSTSITGYAVVAISAATPVATLLDADIFEATSVRVMTNHAYKNAPSNKLILRLLNDSVCPWVSDSPPP